MSKETSMFFNPNTFGVRIATHGSGYEGIHVSVEEWLSPEADPNQVLISRDALTEKEFDLHIDELIGALEKLRAKGHRKLRTINKNR